MRHMKSLTILMKEYSLIEINMNCKRLNLLFKNQLYVLNFVGGIRGGIKNSLEIFMYIFYKVIGFIGV